MQRRGLALLVVALVVVAFERPAFAQHHYVETTALLVTSSHRQLAAARDAAFKVEQQVRAAFGDDAGPPSPWVRAESTWGSYFLDANGWNLHYEPRHWGPAGVHVSIEDSSRLPGLVPGYFVVVIASGTPSEIWPIARRASAAGIKAHVRYTRRLVRVCPY